MISVASPGQKFEPLPTFFRTTVHILEASGFLGRRDGREKPQKVFVGNLAALKARAAAQSAGYSGCSQIHTHTQRLRAAIVVVVAAAY